MLCSTILGEHEYLVNEYLVGEREEREDVRGEERSWRHYSNYSKRGTPYVISFRFGEIRQILNRKWGVVKSPLLAPP